MHTRTSHSFNLVEIILALGVIMIGVVSLMGLFPLGAKTANEAVSANFTADIMGEVVSVLKQQDFNVLNGDQPATDLFGGTIPVADDTTAADLANLSQMNLTDEQLAEFDWFNASNWVEPKTGSEPNKKPTFSSRRYFRYEHEGTAVPGVLLAVNCRSTTVNATTGIHLDTDEIISRAIVTVWRSPVMRQIGGATFWPVSNDDAVRINVKVAWPAELPDAERSVSVFSFDVYRQLP